MKSKWTLNWIYTAVFLTIGVSQVARSADRDDYLIMDLIRLIAGFVLILIAVGNLMTKDKA
jgi:hypothetical protein